MTPFQELELLDDPPIRWALLFSGFDKVDGSERLFTVSLGGGSFIGLAEGQERDFEDVSQGSIDLPEQITTSSDRADNSFLSGKSSLGGTRTWRFLPGKKMANDIRGVRLPDGRFEVYGWGLHKADGTAFPFASADLRLRGQIDKARVVGMGVHEISFLTDDSSLDLPFQTEILGGFGVGAFVATPAVAQDPVGSWLDTLVTTSYDVTGPMTLELFILAEQIPTAQITADYILGLNGTTVGPVSARLATNNYGLILESGGTLGFAAGAQRVSSTFTPQSAGWVYVSVTVASDGKTVKLYGANGRDPESVVEVGSGVLGAAIAPVVSSAFVIGNPFLAPAFLPVDNDVFFLCAEERLWTRALPLEELQKRRVRTFRTDTDDTTGLAHLHRFEGSSVTVHEDQIGTTDFLLATEIVAAEVLPTLDGPPDDAFDTNSIGQTVPIGFGRFKNGQATFESPKTDGYLICDGLTRLQQVRSAQAPITINESLTGVFDFDITGQCINFNVAEDPSRNFFRILQPDPPLPAAGLAGQVIEAVGFAPNLNGEYHVTSISADGRQVFVSENLGQSAVGANGTIRTPIAGPDRFAAEEYLMGGGVILDRATNAITPGNVTTDSFGLLGPGDSETISGLVSAMLEKKFGAAPTLNLRPGFLDLGPAGKLFQKGGSQTTRDALWETLRSAFGWWRLEMDESYTLGTHALPQGNPVATLGPEDGLDSVEQGDSNRPLWAFDVLYEANNFPQDPDAAAGVVPIPNTTRHQSDGQRSLYSDLSVKKSFRTAIKKDEGIKSLLAQRQEADLLRNAMAALLANGNLRWYKLGFKGLRADLHRPGDEIVVKWPEDGLGLENGRGMIIVSKVPSTDGTVTMEAYGEERSFLVINDAPIVINGAGLLL